MTLFEALSVGVLAIVVLVGVFLLVVVLRNPARSSAGQLLGEGDFAEALAVADTSPSAEREDLRAAAIASRQMLELERAQHLGRRLIELDGEDGEAWLELGLAQGYAGSMDQARESLGQATRLRADLLESISLHRAWLELRAGRKDEARAIFEEIAAPLESKLRHDLGPGDPLFAEWFLHAADLWEAAGDSERADWARREAHAAAPGSPLVARFG